MSRGLEVTAANAASGAVAAEQEFKDVSDLERVIVTLDTAATQAGALTVTLDSNEGTAYDAVLWSLDPSVEGGTVFIATNLGRFVKGDKVVVAYANPDARTWSAAIYFDRSAEE